MTGEALAAWATAVLAGGVGLLAGVGAVLLGLLVLDLARDLFGRK